MNAHGIVETSSGCYLRTSSNGRGACHLQQVYSDLIANIDVIHQCMLFSIGKMPVKFLNKLGINMRNQPHIIRLVCFVDASLALFVCDKNRWGLYELQTASKVTGMLTQCMFKRIDFGSYTSLKRAYNEIENRHGKFTIIKAYKSPFHNKLIMAVPYDCCIHMM